MIIIRKHKKITQNSKSVIIKQNTYKSLNFTLYYNWSLYLYIKGMRIKEFEKI